MLEQDDSYSIAVCYSNIADMYVKQKKYNLALSYIEKALEKYKKIGHQHGIAFLQNSIAPKAIL